YPFFFFQAEDGIRDRTVTGVQTCALPISPAAALAHAPRATPRSVRESSGGRSTSRSGDPSFAPVAPTERPASHRGDSGTASRMRSEERRVGEGGGGRGRG